MGEMWLTLIAILAILQTVAAILENMDLEADWISYKKLYNKSYSFEVEKQKFKVFSNNLERINQHNFEEKIGLHSYKMGLNQLTDMSRREYIENMTYKLKHTNRVSNNSKTFDYQSKFIIPDQLDWRVKGVVSPVRDQGQCGSSILFDTIDIFESFVAIKIGQIIPLSEQQLLECCAGCSCTGGFNFYDCIKNIGGLDSAVCYSKKSQCGKCQNKPKCIEIKCKGYSEIKNGDENALKNAVALVGPIIVEIDASQSSFQFYSSGIYDDPLCNSDLLDHSVLVVGYGLENGVDFWLVKNSWGTSWGENGYMKMSRNKNNQCGIATSASYPLI